MNYSDNYYLLSQRFEEVPRLTPAHYEAMALFNELAASRELRLEMILQPGDIQLLNNHTCLHYRSAFVDYPVSLSLRKYSCLCQLSGEPLAETFSCLCQLLVSRWESFHQHAP